MDIRHIAFSSAYLGYALVALDFALPAREILIAALGLAAVGLANLTVSFFLALYVGLKARQVSFAQGRGLVRNILARLVRSPREFLLPPRPQGAPD